jgi:diguanylate cyclase (GGDEF)-like protein
LGTSPALAFSIPPPAAPWWLSHLGGFPLRAFPGARFPDDDRLNDEPAKVSKAGSARRVQRRERLGLEETPATRDNRRGALLVCVLIALVTASTTAFGLRDGPHVSALVPICATVWSLADLLTAVLLVAQFYVKGAPSFGIVAIAYGLSAMFTWPYLVYFPGLFWSGSTSLAGPQVSAWLWMIWHITFPALIFVAALDGKLFSRIVSQSDVRRAIAAGVGGTILAAAAVSTLLIVERAALPSLTVANHFEPLLTGVLMPIAIGMNLVTCILLLRTRPLGSLTLWLAVAMFSEAADLLLHCVSAARYSYAWDVGRLLTISTACIVLVMMLCEVVALYGRLAGIARTDPLTSLPNRRAFEEYFDLVLGNARRLHGSLGLLVLDVDFFKKYNDTHGHLAGDECLRRISRELSACAGRPLDLVARYGGEEFVVALPDTSLNGVLEIAERIRARVEGLRFTASHMENRGVTVSIGVSHVRDAHGTGDLVHFETADRALYRAKKLGRNQVRLGEHQAPPVERMAPLESTG